MSAPTAALAEWLIAFRDQFLQLSLFLSIPSALLYILELCTIARHRQFHCAFYALFTVRACSHLVFLANSYYGYRLPILFGAVLRPLYSVLPSWTLALYFFLGNFTYVVDHLSTTFLLANRLTAISCPLRQNAIWRKLLPVSILVILGIPLFVNLSLLRQQPILQALDSVNNSFVINLNNAPAADFFAFVATGCSSCFLTTCLVLNCATLLAYKRMKRRRRMSATEGGPVELMERKLMLYAIVTFAGHCMVTVLLVTIFVFTIAQNQLAVNALYTQYPWVMDTSAVVLCSVLLLWASDQFRLQFLHDFAPKFLAYRMVGSTTSGVVAGAGSVHLFQRVYPITSADRRSPLATKGKQSSLPIPPIQ